MITSPYRILANIIMVIVILLTLDFLFPNRICNTLEYVRDIYSRPDTVYVRDTIRIENPLNFKDNGVPARRK